MLNSRFLEGMNGALFILLACCAVMFLLYVIRETWYHGFERARLQAGISVLVFVAGEAVSRAWIWWWRYLENRGHDNTWMAEHPVLFIGAGVQIIGLVCMIRVFAPDHWGRNIWIAFVSLAIAVTLLFTFLA